MVAGKEAVKRKVKELIQQYGFANKTPRPKQIDLGYKFFREERNPHELSRSKDSFEARVKQGRWSTEL